MFQFGSNKHKKLVSAIVILLVVVMVFSSVAVALREKYTKKEGESQIYSWLCILQKRGKSRYTTFKFT